MQDGIFETGQQMAEEVGKAASGVTHGVLDLSDAAHDSLVAAEVVQPKDATDRKYAASISSITKEQELTLDVSCSTCRYEPGGLWKKGSLA